MFFIENCEPLYFFNKLFLAYLPTNNIDLFIVLSFCHEGFVQHHLVFIPDQFLKVNINALDSTFLKKHLRVELLLINFQQTE